ncbi:MAG: Rossmann-like and DUF2520 domain-containing protein [Paludibacteraceae bacterium]
MKIVLLGAGNVATHIGKALYQKGYKIVQVFSKTEKSAKELSEQLNTKYCFNTLDVLHDADVYIYLLKDSALGKIIAKLNTVPDAIHIHTSGSVSINIFENRVLNYGVLYPLQTFSKEKKINIEEVPFFIEASNEYTQAMITHIACSLSERYTYLNSEQRMMMHLAAVFACNFSNFMYLLASDIVSEAGIKFEWLLPLISETADKVNQISPEKGQTGPAVRGDKEIINKHIELLHKKKDVQGIYALISESIYQRLKIR